MKKLIIYYNFVIVNLMAAMGFIGAKTTAQLISAVLFFPLAVYFWLLVLPKRKKALVIPEVTKAKPAPVPKKIPPEEGQPAEKGQVEDEEKEGTFNLDRRAFIKLIGSAGATVFLFSLFTKKAQATFFGSVPGPGTVALKDTAGAQIDPAIKTPTDGYKVTEIDDSSPAYYGFVEKTGKWFIMQDDSGKYRYTKGDSGFPANWTGRGGLIYDYFDEIFGES